MIPGALPLREETLTPTAEYCTKQGRVALFRKTHLCAYLPGPFAPRGRSSGCRVCLDWL